MKTNIIELRPDRLDLPLAPCACGRLSSAVITVGGDGINVQRTHDGLEISIDKEQLSRWIRVVVQGGKLQ